LNKINDSNEVCTDRRHVFSDDALEGGKQETTCFAGTLVSNAGVKAVVEVGVGGKRDV
jgi:hypothetical protein